MIWVAASSTLGAPAHDSSPSGIKVSLEYQNYKKEMKGRKRASRAHSISISRAELMH